MTEKATVDSLGIDQLIGKRVAIIGFTPEDARPVQAAFEGAGVFFRVLTDQDVNSGLDAFDVAVLQLEHDRIYTSLTNGGVTHRPPVLLIGSKARIQEYLIESLEPGAKDFLISGAWSVDELLLRMLSLVMSDRVKKTGGAETRTGKPTVLIADDDSAITTLLQVTLTKSGFDCHIARDGGAALDLAQEIRPDLVILDVNMPNRDGFEVLSMLRQCAETAGTRVVMLTASEQEVDVLRGFGLGADDYVIKPFNPMEMIARVKGLLGRTQHLAAG